MNTEKTAVICLAFIALFLMIRCLQFGHEMGYCKEEKPLVPLRQVMIVSEKSGGCLNIFKLSYTLEDVETQTRHRVCEYYGLGERGDIFMYPLEISND